MIGGSMRKSFNLKQEENAIDLGNKIEKKKKKSQTFDFSSFIGKIYFDMIDHQFF